MPERFTYLLVDIFCILFPLLFSFSRRFHFFSQWRYYLVPCLATATIFIAWDVLFTALGVWGFSRRYVMGPYIANLPLEEVLFFICIPYACTFTYYCLRLYAAPAYRRGWQVFALLLALALVLTGVVFLPRLYTSVTFITLAAMLLVLAISKVPWLPAFFISYLLILLPFFISNGTLTGGYLQRVVVFYNDRYNLGVRLGTIPVEDIFYGMLLSLLNIAGYEYARGHKTRALKS